MTKRSLLSRSLHSVGILLAIAGIVFVALRLHDQVTEIDFARFDWWTWSIVAALAMVYGLANGLLALAWWNLLGQFGANTSRHQAIKVYGLSQIAKYVPGNIMHLAGRQALGLAAGLPGWSLAKSTAWELSLLAIAGAIFSCLTLPLLVAKFPIILSLGLFLAAIAGATALLWHILGPKVAHALAWYAVFLAISGLVFVVLIKLVIADTNGYAKTILYPLVGAYVLAWLAGLLTPGAPAGMGVRELVLLLLLNEVVGEAELLLAVVLGRLVTIAGDISFFVGAIAINKQSK